MKRDFCIMKNNIFTVFPALIIVMLAAVMVMIKLANDSLLVRLAVQEQRILALQKGMNQRGGVTGYPYDKRMQGIENRLTLIENGLKSISAGLQMRQAAKEAVPAVEDYEKVYDIPIGKSAVRGNTAAKVTIIGFLDLQCPFSARFQPVINQVLEAYPGKVNYVIKHFPLSFHQQAKPAAKAILAAGEQGKYWEMADSILKNSRDLSKEKLEEFAKALKLNMKKFEADFRNKDAEWEKLIQEDYELGLKVDVTGTPTYYINGRKTRSRDLESFKKEIDTLLQFRGQSPTS
jgi:protein-disulfide isomerase